MMVDPLFGAMSGLTAGVAVVADAAITWTPKTFYIAAAIVHTVVYLLGFKLLQADPEQNTFVGAVIAAVIANRVAYLLAGYGLFGILAAATVHFVMLVAISSGEALKSLVVFLIAMAAYAGLGAVVIGRTDLSAKQIGGLAETVISGKLKAEPITEEQANEMAAPAEK